VDILHEMVPFIQEVKAVQWSVFFLVPTGRAMIEQMISAEQHERVFNWLYDLSQNAPFDIKGTAAPMYRRVAIERKKAEAGGAPVTFQGAGFQYADGLNRPTKGVNDGNGFLFISHIGEIQPSGFLPLTAGTVRENDVVDVYRNHPLFKDLRDYSRLKGKCGYCEYRDVCGGQRGRAYGITGDYMETDPACAYEPKRKAG
jgi:radical SAM protein with 4Fe4S-binding SPASM domain